MPNNYTKELENQNEELKQLLAKLYEENESLRVSVINPRWVYSVNSNGTLSYAYYGADYYVIARMTQHTSTLGNMSYTYAIINNPSKVEASSIFYDMNSCMDHATIYIKHLQKNWMDNQAYTCA